MTFETDQLVVTGTSDLRGGLARPLRRSDLEQNNLQQFTIPLTAWRIWNNLSNPLTNTPNTDDLGLLTGDVNNISPTIQTSDLKGAGATLQFAGVLIALPIEYVAGETVVIRLHAGMFTTESDGTATAGLQVHRSDEERGFGAELAGDDQSINSLTLADLDINIASSTLNPGDSLAIRLALTINDAATPTAVKGMIGATKLLCDVKG